MGHVVVELVEYKDGVRRRLGWTDQARHTKLIARFLLRIATAHPRGRIRASLRGGGAAQVGQ